MEGEVITKQLLFQELIRFHGHVTEHSGNFIADLESVIANSQKRTVYWMVGIFLGTTTLVGTSISIYVMCLLSRL